jgi:hypothetical protein
MEFSVSWGQLHKCRRMHRTDSFPNIFPYLKNLFFFSLFQHSWYFNQQENNSYTPARITSFDAVLFYTGIPWTCLNVNISLNSCCWNSSNLTSVNEPLWSSLGSRPELVGPFQFGIRESAHWTVDQLRSAHTSRESELCFRPVHTPPTKRKLLRAAQWRCADPDFGCSKFVPNRTRIENSTNF